MGSYLCGHLSQERDVHLLALGYQGCEEGLAGPFRVIDGWLVALREEDGGVCASLPGYPGTPYLAHGAPNSSQQKLTKSLRCRAHTSPSPPLFPGPQMTRTVGGLLAMAEGG